MKLKFTILGFEVATVELDQLHQTADTTAEVVELGEKLIGKGIKGISRFWVGRMMRS